METATEPTEAIYRFKGAGDDNRKQDILATYFNALLDDDTISEIHLNYDGPDLRVKITSKGPLPEKVLNRLTDHYYGQPEK